MITTKKTKSILIVANSDNDEGAKLVKQWLIHYNTKFVSINSESSFLGITNYNIKKKTFEFELNQIAYESKDFDTIYFHKGIIKIKNRIGIQEDLIDYRNIDNSVKYYMSGYELSVRELTFNLLRFYNVIGRNNGGRINKIKMLEIAEKAGFDIPSTIVTSSKSKLIAFYEKHKSIITKSLDLNLLLFDTSENNLMHALTTKIGKKEIEKLPDNFPLSYFQQNIEKYIELRIFYIGHEIYASAIFSQNTENTEQDYRNYNSEIPNRVVPFKLPEREILKLKKFQSISGLKTGSVDIILTNDGEYVFLEINPQGQFIAVGNYCNYKLEKVVAKYLSN